MFKDSHITRLDAWSIREESEALPAISYPAFVGSGPMGVGLDAAGLQSLPDRLCAHFNTHYPPLQLTQCDLYVLREGMISSHLYEDEIKHTGFDPKHPRLDGVAWRNFMPLGFLEQSLEFGGQTYHGDELRRLASAWQRDWSLRQGIVSTSYGLGIRPRCRVTIDVFTPLGSSSIYVRFQRSAAPTPAPGSSATASAEERVGWTFRLALTTRHGLPLFDQTGSIKPGTRTLVARIDHDSRFAPAEPYAAVYALAATGMEVQASAEGLSAAFSGPITQEQTAYLRLDLIRCAGDDIARAPQIAAQLEKELAGFDERAWQQARQQHLTAMEDFWNNTADIAIDAPDEYEERRRFLLHMSQYLLRCGNDHGLGGTVQLLFLHMNGWQAGNFHDHHYIIDGLARSNIFFAAKDHVRWLRKVMRDPGRPFPWILNYDGFATIPAQRDRAPMSDANRALLAMRVYELCGPQRDQLLADVVYPIVRRVALHGMEQWFYEEDGALHFRAVENDVTDDPAYVDEPGTVAMYLTVLLKAAQYAHLLGVDADLAQRLEALARRVSFAQIAGRYQAWKGAAEKDPISVWFANALYIAEAGPFLDPAVYNRTRDAQWRKMPCNFPWLNFASASSDIRVNRADRAEQMIADSLEHGVHGPGYFEEVIPVGSSAMLPFASAHGSHLTAACEQVVLPDFWSPRVFICQGLPSRWRASSVRFTKLRALRGLIISGHWQARSLELELEHTGPDFEVELVLRLPVALDNRADLSCDGKALPFTFHGEFVAARVHLHQGQHMQLRLG